MSLDEAASRAATLIRSRPAGTRWFLDCDTDADGISGAVVMARALGRIGHGVQIRASRDKDSDAYAALAEQGCDGYILIDKGTSHAAQLGQLAAATGRAVLIIDHHNVPEGEFGDVLLVNPRLEGMDGSRDASAGTTAAAVAIAMDGRNLDLGPVALCGAVGDWQHHGGWQGWNLDLVERCKDAGFLQEEPIPALIGVDLAEALERAGLPDVPTLLESLGIDGALDAEDLNLEERTRLLSAWTLHDVSQGITRNRLHHVLWNPALETGVRHAFRIADACGRLGKADTGVGFLIGSKKARQEALDIFRDYKQRLGHALARLKAGPTTMEALQWTQTDEAALTGMVAGIGVVHFLKDATRPLVVSAPRPDGLLQISTRGTHEQVAAGLDLGLAIQAAAVAVGAEGGGHPIASGTVIDPASWEPFLAALDAALIQQHFLDGA